MIFVYYTSINRIKGVVEIPDPLYPQIGTLKLQFVTFCVQNVYNKRVHHESIFQTVFWACPGSLRYTYKKCLYSDYFRLVRVGTAAE